MKDGKNNRGLYVFSKLVQRMDKCRRTNVSDGKKLRMPKMGDKNRRVLRLEAQTKGGKLHEKFSLLTLLTETRRNVEYCGN